MNDSPIRKPRLLYDNATSSPESLGCFTCVDRAICGGAHMESGFFSCSDYCRGCNKASCDLVCRGNPALYVEKLREVDNLSLMGVPPVSEVEFSPLPPMIPWIDHNSAREGVLNFPIIAVPFYRIIDFNKGILRYHDRETLAKKFSIHPNARIIISGVQRDNEIERYWTLANRPALLEQLQALDINLITPPNFSVLTGVPRSDNLHAMKRIMIAYAEMMRAGLPTALHVNARTERDYERWTEVIATRGEIKCLSVEFATGAGWGDRIDWHVSRLQTLAATVKRPLRLVMRGGGRKMEILRRSFDKVTIIDTDAFTKTRCRKRAIFTNAGELVWGNYPTEKGAPIDELLQHNIATLHSQHIHLERLHADNRLAEYSTTIGIMKNGNYKAAKGRNLG